MYDKVYVKKSLLEVGSA